MKVSRQIYLCGVSGALGGLVAWLVIGWSNPASWRQLWLSTAFVGVSVGALITVALVLTRGFVEQWGRARWMHMGAKGLALGALGGGLGLLLGQAIFVWIQGSWVGRGMGWSLLGLLVGLGHSAGDPAPRRWAVGGAGGAVGGMFSGLIYEGLTQLFLSQSGTAQLWASSFGLMVVGAFLAGGIPLAEKLAARGILVILSGRRNGAEYIIVDRLVVGKSESCHVVIPDDPDLEPEQISFGICREGIRVTNAGRMHTVMVGSESLPPGAQTTCSSGAVLRVSQTALRVR